MKLRHAAALALVGWYLMVPPIVVRTLGNMIGMDADQSAPLSQWTIFRSYDTASSCMAERDARMKAFGHDPVTAPSDSSDLRGKLYSSALNRSAQCISTDDPRLNAK